MTGPTPPRPDDETPESSHAGPPDPGLGPPAGQDGTPDPPSEFLTPVHPYETVEPEAGGSWPGSAPASAGTPPGRRRSGVGVAVVVVLLVAAGLVWVVGRPTTDVRGAPPGLTATPSVCSAPECERIEGVVALTWSSAGGDVEGYQILRSQRLLDTVGPDVSTYEVRALAIDHRYVFGVRAVRAGDPGAASTVTVRTPEPPLEEAQLHGAYRVRERVRSASNLSSVEGIDHPRPGRTTTNPWSFSVLCEDQAGACPTNWFEWGPIPVEGLRYDGAFRSRPATCGGGGQTPTTTRMRLVVSSARTVDGRWLVDRFHGVMHVAFRCPGAAPSTGTLEVQGHMRSAG